MKPGAALLPLVLLLAACAPIAPSDRDTELEGSQPTLSTPTPPPITPTPAASPVPDPAKFQAMDPSLFFVNDLEASWGSWDSEDVNFASPSHNLGCAILGAEHDYLWGCSINEKYWEFPSDSPDDYCYESHISCGEGIEATGRNVPHPRMRGDPGFPGAFATYGSNDPIRVLQYGQSVTFGNVSCYSETIGVTCENNVSGHGFVLARDRNDIY